LFRRSRRVALLLTWSRSSKGRPSSRANGCPPTAVGTFAVSYALADHGSRTAPVVKCQRSGFGALTLDISPLGLRFSSDCSCGGGRDMSRRTVAGGYRGELPSRWSSQRPAALNETRRLVLSAISGAAEAPPPRRARR
jgi:hypothetical protein